MASKTAEQIALEQMARESGMQEQKDRTLERARMFCNAPVYSAALQPMLGYRQGQIKTADELLRFLEGK